MPSTLSAGAATLASNGTSPTPTLTVVKTTTAPTGGSSVKTTATTVSRTNAPTTAKTAGPTLVETASPTPTRAPTTAAATTRAITAQPSSASTPVPTATQMSPSGEATPSPMPTPIPTTDLPAETVVPTITATPANETVNATFPPTTGTNETVNFTVPTTWPYVTVTDYPMATDTADIDVGMTPYTGPTPIPSPTDELLVIDPNATPTEDPAVMLPVFTAEVVSSPPFELPPGALDPEVIPSPTETVPPVLTLEPEGPNASSFLPRWLGYLLFIFLGISGVAGLAMVGSYLGGRPLAVRQAVSAQPSGRRDRDGPLVSPQADELPIDQQILVDRIAGFSPESMHVERLGRNLLRLEQVAQARSGDRSVRLGRLLSLSAVPSIAVPPAAAAWAREHGFRILAADGYGMALVMPALSSVNRTELGILPVTRMVDGSSPVPMPLVPAGSGSLGSSSSFLTAMGYAPAEPSE